MARRWRACADREQAAQTTAGLIARHLRAALARRERASLVVSGGSTPLRTLEVLSTAELDWRRVTVLPSDERCVPGEHPDSNAGMIRRRLLQGPAAGVRLLPLYDPAAVRPPDLRDLLPFDCVLLGMGVDGHFASLFPDFDGLAQALDPAAPAAVVRVATAASPHPRLSLTLSALAGANAVLLLFFGADKRAVFDAAAAGNADLPVSALLGWSGIHLDTVWSP